MHHHLMSEFAFQGRHLLGRAVRLLPPGICAMHKPMLRRQVIPELGSCRQYFEQMHELQ